MLRNLDDDLLFAQKCNHLQMQRYSDQNQPIMIKKRSVIDVFELQSCLYVVLCSVYSWGTYRQPGDSCVH